MNLLKKATDGADLSGFFSGKSPRSLQFWPHWRALLWLLLALPVLAGCRNRPAAGLPPVMFMDWDENGRIQLYVMPVDGAARQISNETDDIINFAPAPDGRALAYIVDREQGHEIWLAEWNGRAAKNPRLLVNCVAARCDPLVWHPDSRRLLYEKREWATPNSPHLWWLDTQTGQTIHLLADVNEVSANAAISPDGRWVSYASPRTETMEVYNLETGEQFAAAQSIGSPAVWRPDSSQLLIRDLNQIIYHGAAGNNHEAHEHDFGEAVHLFIENVPGGSRLVLDETGNVDDANAAWSPDGEWIAFGRKIIRTNTGRQLWLARADGSEAYPLTEGFTIQHGQPRWSPDGRRLLFQRADLTLPDPRPSLWLLDVETNEMWEIRPSGMLPVWLPTPSK